MERLQKKLADWYRRRAVLRELIFEAERSDDEGDMLSAGAEGSVAGKKRQKKADVTVTKGLGEVVGGGGGGGGGPTAASGGLQQAAVVDAAGGGGEAGGGLPKGRSVNAMDVEGAVGAAKGTEAGAAVGSGTEVKANGSGTGMRGDDDAADFDGRKQRDAGGGVEETKGGEELSSSAVVTTKAAGARGVRGKTSKPKEEPAEISKVRYYPLCIVFGVVFFVCDFRFRSVLVAATGTACRESHCIFYCIETLEKSTSPCGCRFKRDWSEVR